MTRFDTDEQAGSYWHTGSDLNMGETHVGLGTTDPRAVVGGSIPHSSGEDAGSNPASLTQNPASLSPEEISSSGDAQIAPRSNVVVADGRGGEGGDHLCELQTATNRYKQLLDALEQVCASLRRFDIPGGIIECDPKLKHALVPIEEVQAICKALQNTSTFRKTGA